MSLIPYFFLTIMATLSDTAPMAVRHSTAAAELNGEGRWVRFDSYGFVLDCAAAVRSFRGERQGRQCGFASPWSLQTTRRRARQVQGVRGGGGGAAAAASSKSVKMSQGQDRNSNIIDGKRISLLVQDEVKMHVEQLKKEHRVEPGLAVLIIGDRTDSQVYVKHKVIACERCGVRSVKVELGKETTQEEAGRVVRELNQDPSIHGILVQLPIPEHLDEKALLGEISLEKDVDGFHPTNIGLLAMRDRKALAQPCTPSGVMEILRRSVAPP
eukprot:746272-Hanusia_phi.AAC.2